MSIYLLPSNSCLLSHLISVTTCTSSERLLSRLLRTGEVKKGKLGKYDEAIYIQNLPLLPLLPLSRVMSAKEFNNLLVLCMERENCILFSSQMEIRQHIKSWHVYLLFVQFIFRKNLRQAGISEDLV